MGIRQRKNHLLNVLRVHVRGGNLTQEQATLLEGLYRHAKTVQEQDQVTAAVHLQIDGWKTESDRHSRILRDVLDVGSSVFEDEDEDPPGLKAALARARVFVR